MATNNIEEKKNMKQIQVSDVYFLGFGIYSNNPRGGRSLRTESADTGGVRESGKVLRKQ